MKIKFQIIIVSFSLFLLTSCFQQSNTYPVEIFSEMHYTQAQKYQEPPRIPAHPNSVPYTSMEYKQTLDVTLKSPIPNNAQHLYTVNCSFCHGANAEGNGPALEKITSSNNYWYSITGEPHKAPANLLLSELSKDNAIIFVKGGAGLMPAYKNMLSEEEITAIVNYIWDDLR